MKETEQYNHKSYIYRKYVGILILIIIYILFAIIPPLIITLVFLNQSDYQPYKKSNFFFNNDNLDSNKLRSINSLLLKTPCYEIRSKVTILKSYEVNKCYLTIELESENEKIAQIDIYPFINTLSLHEEIALWKKFRKSYLIISEKNITVGNYPAYQILYKINQFSSFVNIIIFVETGNRYQHILKYSSNGFIINSNYDKEKTKSNVDYLISHWKWL